MFSFSLLRRSPADSSATGHPEAVPTDQRGDEALVDEDSTTLAREGAPADSSQKDPSIAKAVMRGACEGLARKVAEKVWNIFDN